VADLAGKPLLTEPERSVDALIGHVLSQRPDLVAKLANLHAKQAEVRKARAEFYPKVAVAAQVAETRLEVSAEGSPYFGGTQPIYSFGVTVELPIFDGFARREKVRIAEAELRSAESELSGYRDAVVREVWKAHTDFKTALRKQIAAAKLLTAAETAYAAVLDSLRCARRDLRNRYPRRRRFRCRVRLRCPRSCLLFRRAEYGRQENEASGQSEGWRSQARV
jgi:outer membrane protein